MAVALWTGAEAQTLDFINADANHIIMNGDNWASLRSRLSDIENLPEGKFRILQIGDSHIQADMSAAVVRRTLQGEFGNGGRGCIAALRMAGTNQPVDYRMSADTAALRCSRLLGKEWQAGMGVTGVAVEFASPERTLRIATDAECGGFTSVTLLHGNGAGYAAAMIADSLYMGTPLTPYATRYDLGATTDSLTLATSFDSPFFGAILLRNNRGLVLDAIGNNGACYSSYLKIADFAKQTAVFAPELIILSLGTNEAFGTESDEQIYACIDSIISQLRSVHKHAKFLLTTPMECHKKVWRTTKRRMKRGKYRSRRTMAFVTNKRVAEVRKVILRYGSERKVPVWDLYEVAGGDGASAKWLNVGLMNPRDHVHCLKSGYELRGSLLADALLERLREQE